MKNKYALSILLVFIVILLTGCKSSNYNKAVDLQEAGNYSSALELFESINDYENYKDTAQRIDTCKEMIDAIKQYDIAKNNLENKNNDLDTAISNAEALIAKAQPVLDNTLISALETAISEAKASKKDIPDMPTSADEILNIAKSLDSVEYDDILANLSDKQSSLEISIQQYALVNAPTEAYIIECLSEVDNIVDISAVTEDNDPNGNLNKAGGYTAQVYFSSDLINQDTIYGSTLIDKGTSAGGSIEVYSNVEDANARNEYLTILDGGLFASGSHTVIGTVLIRTSNELTASQQKTLEANIIAALTKID